MDAQNVDKVQRERQNLLCSIRTGSLSEVPDRDKVDIRFCFRSGSLDLEPMFFLQ